MGYISVIVLLKTARMYATALKPSFSSCSAAAPHIGDREYNMKIRDLREERKRADGLLAKAERMLNVAREDTEHASRSKAAALEELKYATAKLRKYQHLR